MAEPETRKPARGRWRRVFRWCRIALLVLVLLLVTAIVYVNQVGFPGFIRDALNNELAERGLEAQYSRLVWRWHEGMVAEDFSLRQASSNRLGPRLTAERAALRLDMEALGGLRLELEALEVDNGDFRWRITDTNLNEQLRFSDIQAEVVLRENDLIELARFESTFKGMDLNLRGYLLNASALRAAAGRQTTRPDLRLLNETMNRVAGYLNELELLSAPELNLRFDADAEDWQRTHADLTVSLPRAVTRWGEAEAMELRASIRPGALDHPDASIEIQLSGDRIETPWGALGNWLVRTRTIPVLELPQNSSNQVAVVFKQLSTDWGAVSDGSLDLVLQAIASDRPEEMAVEMTLKAGGIKSDWGEADAVSAAFNGSIERENWLPIAGTSRMDVRNVRSDYGTARELTLELVQKRTPEDRESIGDDSWGPWRFLEPYVFDFELRVADVDAQEVQVESARLAGRWEAPQLELNELTGALYGGDMQLSGGIDVVSREIDFEATTDWDYHGLDHKFTDKFARWFSVYQWGSTPHVEVSGKLAWPDWNVTRPDWKADVGSTVRLAGTFEALNPSYRGIPGLRASSTFYLTNYVWYLPDLTLVRPEGTTVAAYVGDDNTKDYEFQIDARVNPHALEPLFKGAQKRAFQHFTNHVTPRVTGTIRGRWREHDLLSFECLVDAPRMSIRGQLIDQVSTRVAYTNRHIVIFDGEMWQSNHVATAEAIGIDFENRVVQFTNVQGEVPPMIVARAIGPQTAEAVAPYAFGEVPSISVDGTLGLDGHEETDLEFDVDGEAFNWWRFNVDQIAGRLKWKHQQLFMTNVTSRFYGGEAGGHGVFTFHTNSPTEFAFTASLTNALFQPLVRDVFQNTNNLAGRLSGDLDITYGNASSRASWDGSGRMHLEEALLWDIPIFAIFSPLLNAVSPGLGSSQADAADASFVLINGTVISTDLEIKSTEINMSYQGSVDHLGNLNAVMEARVLKESGVFGPVISTVLRPLTKLFEYRLTGSLSEPVAEPIYIPRFLMTALEPFKVLGELLRFPRAVPPEAPESSDATEEAE